MEEENLKGPVMQETKAEDHRLEGQGHGDDAGNGQLKLMRKYNCKKLKSSVRQLTCQKLLLLHTHICILYIVMFLI